MSKTLVVMQPTFMPWAGYFNLMSQADEFVFLDDVQLEKQSWQTRNRILVQGQVKWLSLPVVHHALEQKIVDTQLFPGTIWRDKMRRGLRMSYARHPYLGDVCELLDYFMSLEAGLSLSQTNQRTICFVAEKLRLSTRCHLSSKLAVAGQRTDRLVAFCHLFGADEYLSPVGSAEYLENDGFASKSAVRLRFQDYQPVSYTQRGVEHFVSHLSILDVLAHLGWKGAADYVQFGAQVPSIYCDKKEAL